MLQSTNRKSYTSLRLVSLLMTLKYIEGHFSLDCHVHVHFSNLAFASHGLPAIAELLVHIYVTLNPSVMMTMTLLDIFGENFRSFCRISRKFSTKVKAT